MGNKNIPSKIKHSKYKNTGILFELLVRQITADTLENKDSKAVSLLKEYFIKTELGKEYKLYEFLTKNIQLTEGKANIIINTILENAKNLNRSVLNRQKYNLIKEIKDNYQIDEFFKSKISNYRIYASLYSLLEIYNGEDLSDPNEIIKHKTTLLEHLTGSKIDNQKLEEQQVEEFKKEDKSTRILAYKILLEKFNDRYSGLNKEQKIILREFINSVDNGIKLKEFYNQKIRELKEHLNNTKVKDKVVQIKLDEIKKFLVEINNPKLKIKESNLYNLLKYYELLEEIQKIKD